jgi:starch-binding outer membrane protein, SusD/RagB family
MNRTLITPLALSIGLQLGCNDLLVEEPEGFTTTETFFKTGADLNSATIAIYNALRGMQGLSQWGTPELASDQTRADTREPNFNTKSADYLSWDEATGQTGGYWGTGFSIISRANLVLDRGPGIETQNTQMKEWNLAEAKFLRAYAYLWLTKVYDDVPLLLTPAEQANLRPTRTPVEQIHEQIIQDLNEAEAALPPTWPGADGYGIATQGRLTKGAARMALADLYLWRSSFLQKNEWQLASDAAKRVIDSGVYDLNDNYFDTFLPANKLSNREMIFNINNSGLASRTGNIFQLFYYPRDWGLDRGQGGGWGLIHPTDWFLNSYVAGDYRREAGYIAGGCGLTICVPAFADGPMSWKYRKSDDGANWDINDVDTPLYRFAEAILMYAEAQNELGNFDVAVSNLNLIRLRARKGTGSENRSSPADYTGPMNRLSIREAIYMERAWELSFEAKRWFDLVRRDSLEPGYWANSLEQHDPNSYNQGPIAAHKKRFPIPLSQLQANPCLTQNPGYGGASGECIP